MLLNISFLTQIIWVQLTTRGCQVQLCVLFINLSRFCNMHYALCIMQSTLSSVNYGIQIERIWPKSFQYWSHKFIYMWNVMVVSLMTFDKIFHMGVYYDIKSFLLKLKVLRILIFPASILELFPSFYAENFFPSNYPVIE